MDGPNKGANSGARGASRTALTGRRIRYLLTAAASVLAVLYLAYHIFGGFSDGVSLFTVTLTEADRVYDVSGAIFKSEKTITSETPGVVDRLLPDGGKFSAVSSVAKVYRSDDADAASRALSDIDRKIYVYEQSSLKNQSFVSVSAIDAEIAAWYDAAANGGAAYISENETALLVLLARRELAVSGRTGYAQELETLYASRAKLISSLGTASDEIIPGESGWYYGASDGYETLFSADKVKVSGTYVMTVSDYERLIGQKPEGTENRVGSYMTSAVWYYVCEIPLSDASLFSEGKTYAVSFEYASDSVRCTLAKISSDASVGKSLLIFRSDTLTGMSFVRTQTAAVTVSSVSGLRVPISSVRVVGGETGVYILYKGCSYFRRVSVLFESDGYYICDAAAKSGFLTLNDRIITGEKDLYDGKVIE